MEVEFAAPPPPPPIVATVRHRRSPTPSEPVVAGTIAVRRGQPPRVVDATRGRLIFTDHLPIGWPPLPPPVRGPKGPWTGPWRLAPRQLMMEGEVGDSASGPGEVDRHQRERGQGSSAPAWTQRGWPYADEARRPLARVRMRHAGPSNGN